MFSHKHRCPMCSNFDTSVDSSSAANEKGASVMAGIVEVNRKFYQRYSGNLCTCTYMYTRTHTNTGVDDRQWKTVSGEFTSIVSCPNVCYTVQAPHGMSPYGHLGNGCTDLILLQKCSTMAHAKWLMKQRWGASQVCVEREKEREREREREKVYMYM